MEKLMKKILAAVMCILSFEIHALEYEKQFENDQVCIARAKIMPHEEIALHRDVYPQLVIALNGGVITRLEADGREVEVKFPTGVPVFREADPENEFHRSVNKSSEAVELIIVQLKKREASPVSERGEENSHDIAVEIKIKCPMSPELKDFVKSIPPSGDYSTNFEEWKSSFVNNMNQLIRLVESEKILNSFWSINTDEYLLQEVIKN